MTNELNIKIMKNLENLLSDVTSNTIGFVKTLTSQASKVSKKVAKELGIDPMSIQKYSEISVQFGSTYSTRVNNQKVRENQDADFEAKDTYYEMVKGALAQNKKNNATKYAVVTPQKNHKVVSHYLMNGEIVSQDFINQIFNASALKSYKSTTQNLDSEIKHLVIGLKSIVEITLNGETI